MKSKNLDNPAKYSSRNILNFMQTCFVNNSISNLFQSIKQAVFGVAEFQYCLILTLLASYLIFAQISSNSRQDCPHLTLWQGS